MFDVVVVVAAGETIHTSNFLFSSRYIYTTMTHNEIKKLFYFFVFSIVMTMRESREQQHTHTIQLSKTVSLLKHKIQKKISKNQK